MFTHHHLTRHFFTFWVIGHNVFFFSTAWYLNVDQLCASNPHETSLNMTRMASAESAPPTSGSGRELFARRIDSYLGKLDSCKVVPGVVCWVLDVDVVCLWQFSTKKSTDYLSKKHNTSPLTFSWSEIVFKCYMLQILLHDLY